MDTKELHDIIESRHENRTRLLLKKGADYATEDRLSNFKRVGKAIEALSVNELPGELAYCFTLMLLKIDRLINLMREGKEPQNESMDDTIQDLLNYAELSDAVYRDSLNGNKELPTREPRLCGT